MKIIDVISMSCLLASALAFSRPNHVCVRNYENDKLNPCTESPQNYAHVYAIASGKKVCTRAYVPSYCGMHKDYVKVQSIEAGEICTVDYDQEPVLNFCKSLPQFYDYIHPERPVDGAGL
jgi:hypothetical protein